MRSYSRFSRDDALVNDQLRDYWRKPAIREWAARDIIGQSLTIDVTTVIEHYGNLIVTANVGGTFDMRGLPDPLVHAFYFTVYGDRIVQLIILRNRYDVRKRQIRCFSPAQVHPVTLLLRDSRRLNRRKCKC